MARILVVDDEPALRQMLEVVLRRDGHQAAFAANGAEALDKLAADREIGLVLSDLRMEPIDGLELLRQVRVRFPEVFVIIMTAFAEWDTALRAMRLGAYNFLRKPFDNQAVKALVHRALEGRQHWLAARGTGKTGEAVQLIGASPGIQQIQTTIEQVSTTDSTVLVTGESGTGKGVIAHVIHDRSERHNSPFVVVNCSAIPEHLLESEFFGHTKGAFTSADRARKGLFLQADGGTIFLDEIAELPLMMQTKLLHVIEDKIVRPVGSEMARRVDTRIVAATNRDLQEMVSQGRFREDLYFRLSMFNIRMPALRERKGDIRGLIEHLLGKASAGAERPRRVSLDAGVEDILIAYSWPGNVRQLDNVIRRAVILANDGLVTMNDLPDEIIQAVTPRVQAGVPGGQSGGLREQVRRYEAEIVQREIQEAGGDRRIAAQKLGIALSSLYKKLGEAE